MSLILGALLCWAGLHSLTYEMTRLGQRARCSRCGVTRWLRGVKIQ